MADRLRFERAPSALAFMSRAMLTPRRPGLAAQPPLTASWRGHHVGGAALEGFLRLTGLRDHPAWPLLYPLMAGFRLQMAVLTDRDHPLPIWNALQIRNHLVLHRPFGRGAILDFEARAAEPRVLEKGVEIDLHSRARSGGVLHWEGVNTFYYRGRFGEAQAMSPRAAAPVVDNGDAVRWTMPADGGIRCGRLTGDYNGIHLWGWYARRFGFRAAFQHPQRVIGECLAQIRRPMAALPLELEVWLKGPVYYGSAVELRSAEDAGALLLALHVNGDQRPAIVGRLRGDHGADQTRLPV